LWNVRSDVAGIVETARGYQKIYCVTAQFARAKDRARIEDELTRQHGTTVTILDRTWIVDQVIDGDRKDLAFNYLGVGQEVQDVGRLGPSDYSRAQQLDDIEKAIGNPQAFAGVEMQRVTEALVAAKLSRNLERPRTETDGRFARAVRLAEADGTYRQRLETNYEWIWTGFWWFDDIALLNSSYDNRQAGAYLLAPAVWKGSDQPELLLDFAILKRELTVKAASEVGEHDVEAIALWAEARFTARGKPCRPAKSD
jgi:hypothetical protein